MRYHDILSEGPKNDIAAIVEAKKITGAFFRYLAKYNEDAPLKDVPELLVLPFSHDHRILKFAGFEAKTLGLPYDNLWIGVEWDDAADLRKKHDAVHRFVSQDETNYMRIVAQSLSANPLDKTDIGYSLSSSFYVHELTHYLDYERGFKKNQWKNNKQNVGAMDYYRSPVEYNAYYTQGVEQILGELRQTVRYSTPSRRADYYSKYLKDFGDFQRHFLPHFDLGWLRAMKAGSDSNGAMMRRRFLKRFYRLFEYIRDNFPDIDAIRGQIEQEAA